MEQKAVLLRFGIPGFKSSQSSRSDPPCRLVFCSMGIITPHPHPSPVGIGDAAGECQHVRVRGEGGRCKSGAGSLPCCSPPLTASQEGRLCAGTLRAPVLESGPHSLFCAQLVSCHLPTCAEPLPLPANRKSLTWREAGRGCLARLHAQGLWSGQEARRPLGPGDGDSGDSGSPG